MRISDWSSDVCSSDLAAVLPAVGEEEVLQRQGAPLPAPQQMQDGAGGDEQRRRIADRRAVGDVAAEGADRSEEHTSELQSLMRISYAVFCLEKKNNN